MMKAVQITSYDGPQAADYLRAPINTRTSTGQNLPLKNLNESAQQIA